MMKLVFVDTSALIAIGNKLDIFHGFLKKVKLRMRLTIEVEKKFVVKFSRRVKYADCGYSGQID